MDVENTAVWTRECGRVGSELIPEEDERSVADEKADDLGLS